MKKNMIALLLSLAVSGSVFAEVVVIVHPSNGIALTPEQASNIFLGKTSSFPGDGPVTPVDMAEGNAVREEFHSKVTKKDVSQLKAYWSKQTFTGKGTPPKEMASAAEMKKFVASNPGAAGYIEKSALDGSVKAALSVP